MPAPRQQRGASWRGHLPFPRLAVAQDVTWTILGEAGVTISFLLDDITGVLSLAGVPQMLAGVGGPAPTAAALVSGNQLQLTYAVAPAPGTTYILAQHDGALRTSLGGYLAPGSQAAAAVPVPTFVWLPDNVTTVLTGGVAVWKDAGASTVAALPNTSTVGVNQVVGNASAFAIGLPVTDFIGNPIETLAQGAASRYTWDGAVWQITAP